MQTADPALDERALAAALAPLAGRLEVQTVRSCGSTNTVLLEAAETGKPRLLVADHQTAGRGRRGRRWYDAAGRSILASLRRRMRRAPRALGGLSLAAGVAVARALQSAGIAAVALEWPNDLLATGRHAGAKLGGILVETRIEREAVVAVIGVGLNYRSQPGLAPRLRRRPIAVEDLSRKLPSREMLVAKIAQELLGVLDAFEAHGFAALRGDWQALHAHSGRRLRMRLADGRVIAGMDAGVADDGAMRLRTRTGFRTLHSARVVSARPA
jgi:BirA family biotin operon repressor/biotin-[acetyl-CoA-carboxylase] ligase